MTEELSYQVANCTTPNGNPFRMWTRDGTNDGALITALAGEDEYGVRGRSFSGWAIDVGSHVGTMAVLLAMDNPDLRVLAIEAVPENVESIRRNVELNDLGGRVLIVPEAAGAPGQESLDCWWDYSYADGMDYGYVRESRFIGNVFRNPWVKGWKGSSQKVKAVSLGVLLERYGIERVAFCKTDCEGSEWAFFTDPARAALDEVVGEWHDRHTPEAQTALEELFEGTHAIEIIKDQGGIGLFRATRR